MSGNNSNRAQETVDKYAQLSFQLNFEKTLSCTRFFRNVLSSNSIEECTSFVFLSKGGDYYQDNSGSLMGGKNSCAVVQQLVSIMSFFS